MLQFFPPFRSTFKIVKGPQLDHKMTLTLYERWLWIGDTTNDMWPEKKIFFLYRDNRLINHADPGRKKGGLRRSIHLNLDKWLEHTTLPHLSWVGILLPPSFENGWIRHCPFRFGCVRFIMFSFTIVLCRRIHSWV